MGTVWGKVWSHPLLLSACRYIFNCDFRVSSLNGRGAIKGGGRQPLHGNWKKLRPDYSKIHVLNSLWALDEVSTADGGSRIIPGTHNRPELPEDAFDDVLAPHLNEVSGRLLPVRFLSSMLTPGMEHRQQYWSASPVPPRIFHSSGRSTAGSAKMDYRLHAFPSDSCSAMVLGHRLMLFGVPGKFTRNAVSCTPS